MVPARSGWNPDHYRAIWVLADRRKHTHGRGISAVSGPIVSQLLAFLELPRVRTDLTDSAADVPAEVQRAADVAEAVQSHVGMSHRVHPLNVQFIPNSRHPRAYRIAPVTFFGRWLVEAFFPGHQRFRATACFLPCDDDVYIGTTVIDGTEIKMVVSLPELKQKPDNTAHMPTDAFDWAIADSLIFVVIKRGSDTVQKCSADLTWVSNNSFFVNCEPEGSPQMHLDFEMVHRDPRAKRVRLG